MKSFTLPLLCLMLVFSAGAVQARGDAYPAHSPGNETLADFVPEDDVKVQGVVVDSEGEPLIGVNVLEKGNPTNGTITDVDGAFQLTVADDNATLVFTYIGYQKTEMPLNGQTNVSVTLKTSASVLDEVVVVGYGTQVKRDMLGAVSSIEGKELTAFNATSMDQSLQGLAAGVQVTGSSGVPGAPTRVLIRGTNSLFSGTEPLWIIDGMILSGQGGGEINGFGRNAGGATPLNPLATINPNDIESIEVLKDAAATAVYGSRGANGVIIVTTKSGKGGKGTLDLNVNYGISDVVRGPNEIGFVDGPTWLALADESRLNAGLAEFNPNDVLASGRDPNAVLTRDQLADVNYFDEVLRQGSSTDINLSSSRATENLNYYISGNYRRDESILVGDLMERMSLRSNFDFNPLENLSIGTRLQLSYVNRERAPNGGAPGGNANVGNGGYNFANTGIIPVLPLFHPTVTDRNGDPILFDPLSGRNVRANLNRANYINDQDTYRALAGVNLQYNIPFVQGLSIRSELAADFLHASNIEWANTVIREDSKYGFDNAQTFQRINYNAYLSYDRQFGSLHAINLTAGTESTTEGQRRRNIEAQQLFGTQQELNQPGDVQRVTAGYGGELYFRGYFGRLNYKFMDRYMIGASYRYDGSSIFTEDFRWGNFLALSAGWVVSDEPFLVNNEVINFLKFRGSFGQTGNSAISQQATATTYAQWGRYGDTGAGDLLSSIANTAVTWETTDAYDVGADFELFEGRVSGTVSYYVQDVRDMLFQVPIPQSSGLFSSGPTIWDNVGDMQNRGWEVELNTVNIDRGDFQWRMGINFATNENQVTRLSGEEAEIYNVNNNALVTREGDPVGFFRLARYAGIHPEGGYELIEEMDLEQFEATGERVPTGNLIPATRSNLQRHLFDLTDKSSLPTFFGGFNNSFTYKNFSLSALISFSGGNYIYDVARENSVYVNGFKPYREEIVGNYWQNPGDDADFPALNWNQRYDVINEDGTIEENVRFDPQRSGQAHDKYLQKGDFIRMRALSFFYNLPRGVAESLRMQNIRLGFTGNNLFTITGYEGYDPEVVNLGGAADRNLGQGWAGVQLPQLKSYNFSLNVTF
ncbi:SusC/RagA family TonB-linked outer membrane protein [Phaeodactylibacter xiamenensis]|uniref:SusC/RagA family TonB-linked outer membrane protein n=1 Tax=Phaeodactylibacter xiamenensis TaxID=1524460 RepID=UPI003BADA16A